MIECSFSQHNCIDKEKRIGFWSDHRDGYHLPWYYCQECILDCGTKCWIRNTTEEIEIERKYKHSVLDKKVNILKEVNKERKQTDITSVWHKVTDSVQWQKDHKKNYKNLLSKIQ